MCYLLLLLFFSTLFPRHLIPAPDCYFLARPVFVIRFCGSIVCSSVGMDEKEEGVRSLAMVLSGVIAAARLDDDADNNTAAA